MIQFVNITNGRNWLRFAAGLFIVAGPGASYAECLQDDIDKPEFVALVDGNTACGNVQGTYGCRIGSYPGSCDAFDPLTGVKVFTAYAEARGDGKIDWELTDTAEDFEGQIIYTGAGGAEKGGACGRFYPSGVTGGSGNFFSKGNDDVQKTTYTEVCTDGEPRVVTQKWEPQPACPADIQAALDNDNLGDVAWVNTIGEPNANVFCVRSGLTVTECVNQKSECVLASDGSCELDTDGDPQLIPRLDGLVNCDAALDEFPILREDQSISISATGTESEVYVCLPPNMTFEGGSPCAFIQF